MSTLGRKPTGHDAGWGNANPNQSRGTIFGSVSSDSWLVEFGGRVGKYGGSNITGQYAAYAHSGGSLTSRQVVSQPFTINVNMLDRMSGSDFLSKPSSPGMLQAGQSIALTFLSLGGTATFGMQAGSVQMHTRDGISSFPASYGGSRSTEGTMSLWMEYQANRAPKTPTSITINGSAMGSSDIVIPGLAPTFTGVFRDDDEQLYVGSRRVWSIGQADKMSAYQVRIVRRSDSVVVHDSGSQTASSTERSQRKFDYTTPTLVPGSYRVQTRVFDLFGASSGWSSHQFSIASATVTLEGSPSGKITDTTPNTFSWTYNNSSANNTTHKQIRLYKSGVLIDTSGEIAASVARNTSSTFTWAETGFPTLVNGGSYSYSVRAKYLGIWTAWSPQRSFTTNAAPAKPTSLAPNAKTSGAIPTLSAVITDPDDNSSTLSTQQWEITRPDASLIILSQGSYSNNNRWSRTLTSAQVPAQGTYKWRVRAQDAGALWSPWSDYATFSYGSYPTVVLATPTPNDGSGGVTSSVPNLSWTVDGTSTPTSVQQTAYTATVYRTDTDEQVWTSGRVISQDTTAKINNVLLRNTVEYRAEVDVENNVGLVGTSNEIVFTIALIPPVELAGVGAIPYSLVGDFEGKPSGIQITWDASEVAPGSFLRYEILRVTNGYELRIAEIPSQSVTSWVDAVPPFAVDSLYRVRQVTQDGADELPSLFVEVSASVDPGMMTITDVYSGVSDHIVLPLVNSIDERLLTDESVVQTWDSLPTSLVGTLEAISIDVKFKIRQLPGDTRSLTSVKEMTRNIIGRKRIGSNGRKYPRTVCLRDQTGRRLFGRTNNLRMSDGQLNGQADGQFSFLETSFIEGTENGQ